MALQLVKDTAISHIVQLALDTSKACLQNGVGLFFGVQNDLEKIRDSLKDIHDFIVIAEQSPLKNPELMKLLVKLKDSAYDAEDLLEEYAIKERSRSVEVQNSIPVRDTVASKVRKVVTSLVTPVIDRAEKSLKVKELRERLEAIRAEGHTFQLKEKVTNLEIEFQKQRETHSLVNESQVFGREQEKEKIVNWLLSTQVGDGGEDDHISVIPIVGMGGLGKTTLAKLVFHHKLVQNHFHPKIWICVSDDFDVIKLGNTIIKRVTRFDCELRDVEDLQHRLQGALHGKRFLLVLDDVWNEEPEKWNRMRDLLICGGRGSRIVVTTCSLRVARIMSTIQPHILKCLSADGCWSLFSRRAFGNLREEEAHPNLVPIGREIVQKCKGNPLAVITLASLLCFERIECQWAFVRDSEMWNIADGNEHGILPVLRLSYNHLKPHLKQCFAFCALFPKDYEIKKELLIKLWMANDFIPSKGGMDLEDIGEEIFNELVMKSFFQDVTIVKKQLRSSVFVSEHKVTTFRIHDLMHDLAQSAMENEYCVLEDGNSVNISQRVRHVSLKLHVSSLPNAQMLRTFIKLNDSSQQHCDVRPYRFLRALDFTHQKGDNLLTSPGNLQHIRYLNLSSTSIDMLPESFTSLYYLQTLILRGCFLLCELPKDMVNLINLRYLDIRGCPKLTHMPPRMGQLRCLQQLNRFIVGRTNDFAHSGIGELQSLNLRGLLIIEHLQNIKDVLEVRRANLINKPNLTYLYLGWIHDRSHFENSGIEEIEKQVLQGLQPHQNLEELTISGYGGIDFPSWMMDTTFTKLVDIDLYQCWRCKRLPPLGQLPLLKALKIGGFMNVEYIGDEFYGNDVSTGFPSLETLEISNMQKLKTWSGIGWKGTRLFSSLVHLEICQCPMLTTVTLFPYVKDLLSSVIKPLHQGMMQNLKSLTISYCNQLEFFPVGWCNLTSLESLHLSYIDSCDKLISSDELSFLTNIQDLALVECHGLKSLPKGDWRSHIK